MALISAVLLFLTAYFYPVILVAARAVTFSLLVLTLLDFVLLFFSPGHIDARRMTADKLSNGDDNPVEIYLSNTYTFTMKLEIIDELPFQFQKRDFSIKVLLHSNTSRTVNYKLRPLERGEYNFGALNIFATSPLALVSRRFRFSEDQVVPVYPSIIQMRKYDLFAISNRLSEIGIKQIRKTGTSMEFDKIRKYVAGDDYRKINWRAAARRSTLMVNQYKDERSQNVYSVIDMGRVMKMPFDGMTLLDYAINASLVVSDIAIRREDRAGIITFSDTAGSLLPAGGRSSHIFKILELLYRCETRFLESDYEKLYAIISGKVKQRSLILLFTNFETLSSLKRNLAYLIMIARRHFVVTIFFENTELHELLTMPTSSTEKIYIKTISEKFAFEKRQIIKELNRHGIQSILTTPENVTVSTINKYIELKARGFF